MPGSLRNRGAVNVLVSMAGNGAILVAEDGSVHRRQAARGTVKNSVGAGDSMVAGFIAGYLEKGLRIRFEAGKQPAAARRHFPTELELKMKL